VRSRKDDYNNYILGDGFTGGNDFSDESINA
jgi:hypothetical protein